MAQIPKGKILRYNALWPDTASDLEIEFACIRHGGSWDGSRGKSGLGMFEHMMKARALLWPTRYRHRWTDLMYKNFIENTVTILLGCGSSQKTSHASEYALIRYWTSPEDTIVILSTTTVKKLDMAIFGEIKMLWQSGKDRYDFLAGHPLESRQAIPTDDISDSRVRDLRKGIVGLACFVGKQYVGLGTYAGIKQKHIIFIPDELQFMAPTFMDCLPNMMQGTEDLKVIGSGNPKHDPNDQLGKAACPIGGWDSLGDIEKTTSWQIGFENGRCLNLVGTDSPNFDYPDDKVTRFPGLISPRTVRAVATKWGEDSLEYYKQCKGVMRIGMLGNRVITSSLCKKHHAQDVAIWNGTSRKRVYALDPNYGGINPDRCVGGPIEFGQSREGIDIIKVIPPTVIPVMANLHIEPEDQIALAVQRECKIWGIPAEDIFYDSTGKGTIGAAFARLFGDKVPQPVAFGGPATSRIVRRDLLKVDEVTGEKRPMRCNEYYSKFVTELWYSVRHVVECQQMRELPEDVMEEGTMREFYLVSGDRIEVEPKDDTRERMGCSPDLFDWLAVAVEGARQRGFVIRHLGADLVVEGDEKSDWLEKEAQEYRDAIRKPLLNHA